MGYRHRNMYYLTGLPGWMRLGYSPGWVGRSSSGLPPAAQWIIQSGMLPQYQQYLQSNIPYTPTAPVTPFSSAMPYGTGLTQDQEKQMLEQQMNALETQLETIKKRLEELSEE
jgi:hypothetical protein